MNFASTLIEKFYPDAMPAITSYSDTQDTPCFFRLNIPDDLNAALARPYRFFLEAAPQENLLDHLQRIRRETADFAISITTTSAYHQHISAITAHHLSQYFCLPKRQHAPLHTCLHEALTNAIVHGNLGIQKHVTCVDSFHSHYTQVTRQLENPAYANRRILIMGWEMDMGIQIAVVDEGDGFSLMDGFARAHAPTPSGRGLLLIESLASGMWVGSDKRSLFMTFSH